MKNTPQGSRSSGTPLSGNRSQSTEFLSAKYLVTGEEALRRRDSLEGAIPVWWPHVLWLWASEFLTWLTGLAPRWTGGKPVRGGSEARVFATTVLALVLGAAGVLSGGFVAAAMMLLLHGMRSFTSAVGHHMTHGAKVPPASPRVRRFVYDVISAMLLLPSFDAYRKDHQLHHAYAAGPDDADQRFIAHLGVSFRGGWSRFVLTLLDPVFHYRFYKARVESVLSQGAIWRRFLGGATLVALAVLSSASGLLVWAVVNVFLYQAATLLQWATEHLWMRRPVGLNAAETATSVTFGRLLLPETTSWMTLAGLVFFRGILLSGDLVNHDLHHLGRGPWVDAAYVRMALLLDGKIRLHQTVSVRGMFEVAFSAADMEVSPLAPRHMDEGRMLGM